MTILAIETSCDETAIAIAEFFGSKKAPRVHALSHIVLSQIPTHQKFGGVVPNLAKREHQRNLVPLLLRALAEAGFVNSKLKNFTPRLSKNHISFIKSSNTLQRGVSSPPFISERWGARNAKLQLKIKNDIGQILQREPELQKLFTKHIASLPSPPIDAVAVTYGPGLAPALWVGVNFAKALGTLWKKPLIPVNHMEGHLFSALLQSGEKNFQSNAKSHPHSIGTNSKRKEHITYHLKPITFPALALLVSGSHTELVLTKGYGKYLIIGQTLDDAAGEAFDKVARLLGLGYPGGPQIARLADQFAQNNAEINAEQRRKLLRSSASSLRMSAGQPLLPRPMIRSKDYNFSFSGLKTAVLYLVRDLGKAKTKKFRPLIAGEFQNAVVDVLVAKTIRAAKEYKAKTILLGGGVSANQHLRETLAATLAKELPKVSCLLSLVSLSGDNALMIALAAYFSQKTKAPSKLEAKANLRIDD